MRYGSTLLAQLLGLSQRGTVYSMQVPMMSLLITVRSRLDGARYAKKRANYGVYVHTLCKMQCSDVLVYMCMAAHTTTSCAAPSQTA